MTKFERPSAIRGPHFLLVQSEHLLDLPSTILVPVPSPRRRPPVAVPSTGDIIDQGRP